MYVFLSYWLRQPEMFCLKLLFSVQENNEALLTFKVLLILHCQLCKFLMHKYTFGVTNYIHFPCGDRLAGYTGWHYCLWSSVQVNCMPTGWSAFFRKCNLKAGDACNFKAGQEKFVLQARCIDGVFLIYYTVIWLPNLYPWLV